MVLAPSAFDSVPVVTDDDRRLVEAHRAGDPDAFSDIVHRHYRGLLASARRRLGSVSDAEDAVQETLLRAFRGLDRFGTTGDWRLGAWLTRILVNVCADAGTRRQAVDRLQGKLAGVGAGAERDVADLASDPVALDAVRRALDALPASQRRAFVLRVVEDLPYPTVAQELGITEDNARARVQRARAALRQVLTDTRAVSGTLATAPLVLVASLRRSLRHLVGRGVGPHQGAAPHGPTASPGATTATNALSAVSGSAPSVSSLGAAATGSPMATGAQLVGQLAASPIGQAAIAVSGSGAGAGKGSLVIGLAASLATAGALAMPSGSSSPSSGEDPAHPAAHALVASAAPTTTPSTTATAPPAPPTTATTATTSSDGGGSGTAASGSGATPPATPARATSPAWVQLAAAAGAFTGAASLGTGSSPGSPTGRSGTRGTSSGSSSGTLGSASSGSGAAAGTSTSGATGTGPGTAGTGGSTPGATGTAGSSASGATGTAGGSTPAGASGTVALPPGTCTGVPGFDGVSTAPAVPPLSSASVVDLLDTGPVTLGGTASAPGLQAPASVSATANSPGTRVAVTAGTCLAAGGSLLAVDVADATGNEVQLVGSLVGEPQVLSTGSGGPGASTTTTYLFRGSVTQIGGVFTENGPLPWGVSGSFVAEVQVVQPTGTADLTVAFVEPTPATTTPATGSGGAVSSTSIDPATAPSASGT